MADRLPVVLNTANQAAEISGSDTLKTPAAFLAGGDIRTRVGNTGGGDVLARSFLAGPAGFYYITDTSGNRVGFMGPDGSPATELVLGHGSGPIGAGGDDFQINLATGLVSIPNLSAPNYDMNYRRDAMTATSGDSAFRLAAAPIAGTVSIFKNGLLEIATDYTAINSQLLVLNTPASGGEKYEVTYFTRAAAPGATTLGAGMTLTGDMPDGTVGSSYSNTLTRTGGTSPFVYSIYTGILPLGQTLNTSTGNVSGAPTVAADWQYVIKVVSSDGLVAYSTTQDVTIAETLTYTQLNATFTASDISLSNSNLDADSNSTTGGGSSISVDGKITGKFYFEVGQSQQYATNPGFLSGIQIGTADYTGFVGSTSNGKALASTATDSSTWTANGSSNTLNQGIASLTAYHRIAVDVGTGQVWLAASNRSSGAWIGGGDPAAGTTPTYTFTPGAAARKYIASCPRRGAASPTTNRNKLHLKLPASDWGSAAPTGFGPWTANGTPPTTFMIFRPPVQTGTTALPNKPRMAFDGAIDFEWSGRPTFADESSATAFVVWSMDSGATSLRYTGGVSGSWVLKVAGTDRLTAGTIELSQDVGQRAIAGQMLTVRGWWDPVGNTCGIRMAVNGVYAKEATSTASASVIAIPPANAWMGSADGSSPNAFITQDTIVGYNRNVTRTQTFAGCVLGDSTVASYSPAAGVPTSSLIRTVAWNETKLIRSLALGGATISDQSTAWSGFAEKSGLEWVMIEIGLNDVDPGVATATSIAALQSLVTAVNAAKPVGCKVIMAQMTPCYARLVTRYGAGTQANLAYAKWQAMNQAIAGGGGSPITGLDAFVTAHVAALDDGSGNLKSPYDSGDGIHPTNPGRQIIANAWKGAFTALGITLNG